MRLQLSVLRIAGGTREQKGEGGDVGRGAGDERPCLGAGQAVGPAQSRARPRPLRHHGGKQAAAAVHTQTVDPTATHDGEPLRLPPSPLAAGWSPR